MSITDHRVNPLINYKINKIRADFKRDHPQTENTLCVFSDNMKKEVLAGVKPGSEPAEEGALLANANAVESFGFSDTHIFFEMKNGALILKKEL